MKNKLARFFKTSWFEIAILVLLFYIVPIPAMQENTAMESSFLVNTLLVLNPAVSFGLSLFQAYRRGFNWFAPLIPGLLFTPTIFIFYNTTAIPYIFSYIVLSYIGAAAGHSMYKNRDKDA